MSYIGNQPTTVAFLTDQFSGTGSQTAFTLSAAPANTASIIVAVSGVLQDPTTYSVSGLTLTFSAAPPAGTGNISVRFLGIPASGVTTTAYRTVTEFTATAGQTTFTPPSYTVGYINVYRNGALLGTADYTATNGTTVVLASAASSGDLVVVESFLVSSVLNAIPNGVRSVNTSNLPVGTVLQVVNVQSGSFTSSTGTFPFDNTIPQNTEGTELFTVSITPTSASSKLLIQAVACLGNSAGDWMTIALFQDSTANALAANLAYQATATGTLMMPVNYYMTAGTTSSTTFKIRYGSNGSTTYVNGNGSGKYGGTLISSLTVTEIAA